ncbi:unnamed protein product [Rhodiola kirilowii]
MCLIAISKGFFDKFQPKPELSGDEVDFRERLGECLSSCGGGRFLILIIRSTTCSGLWRLILLLSSYTEDHKKLVRFFDSTRVDGFVEKQILSAVKYSAGSSALSSWNESSHFCQWQGVVCGNKHQRVISLMLDSQGLIGSLPPSIGNLTFLKRINFAYNKLGGTIPKEMGSLPRLQYLNLSDNYLISGHIPVELMNCSDLRVIHMSSNNLTGSIPLEVGHLSKLRSLFLDSNSLSGTIPSSIGYLSELQVLWLPENNLIGTIPKEMGSLSRLQYLSLTDNLISGHIPVELMNCSDLRVIDMGSNNLTGSIPLEVGYLSKLRSLFLDSNSLSGTIPSSIGYLSELQVLWLPENNLTGTMPSFIGNLSSLVFLNIGSNFIEGEIAPDIGNLTFLKSINFAYNKLGGTIPKEMGSLPRLQYLNLSHNYLISGHIPVELMNCSDLRVIHISSNNLTGSIPLEVGYLSKLSSLIIDSNSLIGTIPSSIGYLSELQHLWLPANNLTGTMPSFIGNLSSLVVLNIGSNFIEGEITPDIGKLKNLTRLGLFENLLSGTIPASFYNLSSAIGISVAGNNLHGEFITTSELNVPRLISLIVGDNQFTGSIPAALLNISTLQIFDAPFNNLTGKANQFGGEFPASFFNSSTQLTRVIFGGNRISGSISDEIGKQINLIQLDMDDNDLQGVIPESIGNLVMLKKLDFSGNRLTGSIPDSLGNLRRLFSLDFANNSLEGEIPFSLRQCNRMQILILSQNKLSGEIPKDFLNHFDQLIWLELHQNSLTGSLPSEVSSLKNLGDLYLSDNKFSGEIPALLGECIGLEFLDMSGNYLEGSIPSSLSELKALRFLDVSRNNLSGRFPTELENLRVMWYLNLSSNNFEGQVPTGGVFGNYSGFFFEENGKLCGGIPQFHLPNCSGRRRKTLSTIVIIVIVTACVGFSALMTACLVIYWRGKVRRRDSSLAASPEENGLLRVSYKDLYEATSGFDSSNIIGAGSFGSVYKGFLFQGQQPVAVKVLNLQKHSASKTFQAECSSLGTIRHRNLLKILTTCSSIDYKGNEFMALVFELMPNGSLENWLHESRNMAVGQRLDVGIDIALALDYLHNGCEPPIVHCDLKPSNVLLDDDMVAHVGDFGLAKVMFDISGEHSTTGQSSSYAVKGSIGYIPPEYGMGSKISPLGDVYSFGIMLLEMITGMRPTNNLFTDGIGIHEYVMKSLPDNALDIIDSTSLRSDGTADEKLECIVSILEIGVACSVENPGERMNIVDVLKALLVLKTKAGSLGQIPM